MCLTPATLQRGNHARQFPVAMADKYKTLEELRQSECNGTDYRLRYAERSSSIAIVAPHGGEIEPATSEIAIAIAGDDHSFYCFEGIKPGDNADLHITSTRFDEPACLDLLSRTAGVVTVHGLARLGQKTHVGGRHDALRDEICNALKATGFVATIAEDGGHAGTSHDNICNKGTLGAGAQLEIERELRDKLRESEDDMDKFAHAVRSAIAIVFSSL